MPEEIQFVTCHHPGGLISLEAYSAGEKKIQVAMTHDLCRQFIAQLQGELDKSIEKEKLAGAKGISA